MRIVHAIRSDGFAGVETHVARLAAAQHDLGHQVTVIGGDPALMRSAVDRPGVDLHAAQSVVDVIRHLRRLTGSRQPATIVHTHMTAAEAAAVVSLPLPSHPIVTTRHFAAERGSSPLGRIAGPWISHRVSAQIAVSQYIAAHIDDESEVVHPGMPTVAGTPASTDRDRTVLLVQRLEPEKATDVAIRAFAESGLADHGWRLRIAGDGSERPALESLTRAVGIDTITEFLGLRRDVRDLMASAGVLVAPCPVEGLGMTVLEAMAAALPVVASAAGGHLETVGQTPGSMLFPAGDVQAAAAHLKTLAADPSRRDDYGRALQSHQRAAFSLSAQADATDDVYRSAAARSRSGPTRDADREVVVISLEPWDQVWRRNQHLVSGLLRGDRRLRVLFVEPPVDPLHAVSSRHRPRRGRGLRRGPHLPGVDPDALWLHEPTKWLPRRVDRDLDQRWAREIRSAASRLGMRDPVLWVNDPTGSELMTLTGWPTFYDITDDWLEADRDEATHDRLVRQEQNLMRHAHEVVVCSTGLRRTKSAQRPVTLLRNAVDVAAARTPAARPDDLPPGPVAVYVGTLHGDRLDVGLCVTTARELGSVGTVVLVGPDALTPAEQARLDAAGVVRLGARDRRAVPGYLQHADVLLVPHVVDDFTESLDPIKLYEYRAVGRPVVSTPVSGFREAAGPRVHVVEAPEFPRTVTALVPAADRFPDGSDPDVPTWADRVEEMAAVIDRVATGDESALPERTIVPLAPRIRLGHAAVQHVADEHGIDLLHIKGEALAPSLVHPGRDANDVDVLVRPSQVQDLVDALVASGFTRKGRFATSSPFEHSITLVHDLWGHIDVHRHFPGLGPSPSEAFDRLWRGRGDKVIAGRACPVPEVPAQALILLLHAARNTPDAQPSRDVAHVWARADADARAAIEAVATDLRAQVPFAVATGTAESLPPSAELDLWQAVSHPDGRVREWRARIAAAPTLPARLRLIARVPLVNTDHLAIRLGHRPSALEIAHEFVGRGRRAIDEARRRR